MKRDDLMYWQDRWIQAMGRIGFLLLPQFSMLELFCAIDALRIAARFGNNEQSWHLYSHDGQSVTASNGIEIPVNGKFGQGDIPSILFVMASYEPLITITGTMRAELRRMARYGTLLGGVDTGAFILAECGLLLGRRVTMHWEAVTAFSESYPQIVVSPTLYEFDRDRLTCAGGSAVIDMMLFLIGLRQGDALMRAVAEQIIHPPLRTGDTAQRDSPARRYALCDRRLARVVELMEKHIEQPIPVSVVASEVGLSQRQLERLCHRYLGRSAKNFYLAVRLEKARQMLTDSGRSVSETAFATGFGSLAHFSRMFRQVFGCSPSSLQRTGNRVVPEMLARMPGKASVTSGHA
ncbi:GlxA family transcriptional regulator [Acetobacter conturbans]|uniref:Helix-turn-helix domain-containing protein n=1 Tax=Acetobacter conturbans TaxID=1737472 RepID=A0ABX0K5C9_9PROT|nr:GlxA family transcriptional regulator [Acetobacter conturbans]NHN90051.1 helix-turn-helix domain-containing protein [Acetobacter conturbans]